MAVQEFHLPDPGEGLVEADIVTWRVAVGDTVAVNDILLEIETSKSLVELPSPYEGKVTALLVAEGDTVDVGRPIIAIDDGTADVPAPVPAVSEPADGGTARVPNLVGYGPKTTEAKRRPRKAGADPVVARVHDQLADRTFSTAEPVSRRADERAPLLPGPSTTLAEPTLAEPVEARRPLPHPGAPSSTPIEQPVTVLAKPPVRKLAKDLGIDLRELTGSGPGGVITRADVEEAGRPRPTEAAPAALDVALAPSVTPAAGGFVPPDRRVPIKGVRKATAQAMVKSAFTAPHVTEWVTCDVTGTMDLVEQLKARKDLKHVKISPTLIVAKAVLLALGRTPDLNSFWDEAAGEIVVKGAVNLGIAAATPRGLVVPNIKNAQAYDLRGLAEALNAVVATAREGRTQPADMAGGTFTITNVGVFGIDAGTPILNPGESGILAVGSIARRPWVVGTGADERIEPRWVTTLAVSFDHRLADGEQGARFLSDVAQILGNPGLGLLF